MKRFFLFLTFASTLPAWELSWDPNEGLVSGYRVYYKDNAAPADDLPIVEDIGNQTAFEVAEKTRSGHTYTFWVTAYAGWQESEKSVPVVWKRPKVELSPRRPWIDPVSLKRWPLEP